MPEIQTHGFNGWWPVKEFLGKTRDGQTKVYRESFRNMQTGEFHHDERGWNGEPPYPTGDIAHLRAPGDLYRENYDQIRWDR